MRIGLANSPDFSMNFSFFVTCASVSSSTATTTIVVFFMEKRTGQTALQRHVGFFDRDNDGIITLTDTYMGFRRLTYNCLVSFLAAIVIHIAFSYITRLGFTWLPDPFFRLYIRYIHKTEHGSHTGVYDMDGEFDQHIFDKIMDRYSSGRRSGQRYFTGKALRNMIKGQRLSYDPFGSMAAIFEWGFIWILCFDPSIHGVWEEDIRAQYDGSGFWKIEEMAKRGQWKRGYGMKEFIRDLLQKRP